MNSPLDAHPDARRDDPSAARSPTSGAATGAYTPSVKRIVELDAIFGEGGLFARALDNYRPRASQIDMARAVAAAMEASGKLMPEPEIFETRKRPARRMQDGAAAGRDDSYNFV